MNTEQPSAKIKEEARALMSAMHQKMKDEFERYKKLHYNPNTKGGGYEKVVLSMLTDYIGSAFNFHQRAQLIDAEMKYMDIFAKGSNEIDVIATFRNASPNLILKIQDTEFVPYDAVAFMIEVKERMDKSNLEVDLDKLRKIAMLPLTPDRCQPPLTGSYNIERPLRILFYYDISIDDREEERLLLEHYSDWDLIVVLQKDVIILNMSLPISDILPEQFKNVQIFHWEQNPLVSLLLIILASVPMPLSVSVLKTFLNLDRLSKIS